MSCVRISRNIAAVTSFAFGASGLVNGLRALTPVPQVSGASGSYIVRGYAPLFSFEYSRIACPICRRLLPHFTRLAGYCVLFTVGNRIAATMTMMKITASNSKRVKPAHFWPLPLLR